MFNNFEDDYNVYERKYKISKRREMNKKKNKHPKSNYRGGNTKCKNNFDEAHYEDFY